MITLIEALNYSCLRHVCQPLDRFHVLVGPNASGKTTFLDVVAFLGTLVSDGLESVIRQRTPDPRDLLFNHSGDYFELAIEAAIPSRWSGELPQAFSRIRYEVRIHVDPDTGETSIVKEILRFKHDEVLESRQRLLFPEALPIPQTIVLPTRRPATKVIVSKNATSGKDNFYPEIKRGQGGGWVPSFSVGTASINLCKSS